MKNIFVLLVSIVFYSWGAPKFIFVILGTTLLDFFLVRFMDNSSNDKKRKLLLIVSICINVGLLFYFKYCDFFIDNINSLLEAFGMKPMKLLNVLLPIGISFYTFESLTYVIDVYRKEHKPLTNFLNYQLYIILFPKLIAGPIIPYKKIADQITNRFQYFTYDKALRGFQRFVIGLSKKVLIANTVGAYADLVYQTDVEVLNSSIVWLGTLAYTLQIYFDFSGYSDMALGIGQMMGFQFPENFDNPYTSKSISEFWRRWHITLGTWMRNYLYIPLGGNRVKSKTRLYVNLWIVFVLSGFWHGAAWTFIAWGVFHGLLLVLERTSYGRFLEKIGKIPAFLITFFLVNIGWIFFKSDTLEQSFSLIKMMFSFQSNNTIIDFNYTHLYVTMIVGLLFSFFTLFKPLERIQNRIYFDNVTTVEMISYSFLSVVLFLLSLSLIVASNFNPFIYFRF